MFRYTPLTKALAKASFSCGDAEMDEWFTKLAWQAQTARSAAVWVQQDDETGEMTGFYTLSPYLVQAPTLPPELRKGLSAKGEIGCTLLGRLGVQTARQGQGAMRDLLVDALLRAYRVTDVSSTGIVLDARTDKLVQTYAKRGFVIIDSSRRRMYLPMTTIKAEFAPYFEPAVAGAVP